ncbi:hypothetical protein LC087_02145 [Bacillus carboniphilus]|uniref:Uncharacterized protein n=1 Tax=Bacillus carboniphilus TaxID=86663 RepID=A0ABY9JUG2_9BACI|nr:hypothetical protein [Bacillus carboniphilus]WLR43044.1 hypothetical protein LC087_02145 [Bacillus carboniphilus]
MQASNNAGLVLTHPSELQSSTKAYIGQVNSDNFTVLGGPVAIESEIVWQIDSIIQ